MKKEKEEKLNKNFQKIIAEFIERESNRLSLITVTKCEISKDQKQLKVFVSVFPEEKEQQALNFLERKKREIREYLKKRIRTRVIPFLSFHQDKGEKNRQKIDQLLKEV